MTDFIAGTGGQGSLIIRDDGYTVTAMITCSNGSTWVNGASWSIYVNGSYAGGSFNFHGAGTIILWQQPITVPANVSFSMGSTGTSGLGGPATVNAYISRYVAPATTPPPAPNPIGVDMATPTSLRYRFSSTGTGGLPSQGWQIGYSSNNKNVQLFVDSGGTTVITGLIPDSAYYFWSRGKNALGYGPWSRISSGRTTQGARVRVNGSHRFAVPYVRVNGAWHIAAPYVKKNGTWYEAQ